MKRWVLLSVLLVAIGVAVAVQAGGLETLIQKLQEMIATKKALGVAFLNLMGPGEKAVEGAVTNAIAGIEEPAPLSSVLLSSLEQALDSKPQAIEQAFLISPQKEPGPVGNEITF